MLYTLDDDYFEIDKYDDYIYNCSCYNDISDYKNGFIVCCSCGLVKEQIYNFDIEIYNNNKNYNSYRQSYTKSDIQFYNFSKNLMKYMGLNDAINQTVINKIKLKIGDTILNINDFKNVCKKLKIKNLVSNIYEAYYKIYNIRLINLTLDEIKELKKLYKNFINRFNIIKEELERIKILSIDFLLFKFFYVINRQDLIEHLLKINNHDAVIKSIIIYNKCII